MIFSTNFRKHARIFGNENALRTIKQCGYDACDFSIALPKTPLEDYPNEEFENLLSIFKIYREIAQKNGVDIYQTHAKFYCDLDWDGIYRCLLDYFNVDNSCDSSFG